MKALSYVYLLVGPRGAGKSTYAEKLLAAQPELLLISRDNLLMEEFGVINRYNLEWARHKTLDQLTEALRRDEPTKIILDYWTGYNRHRKVLIEELRGRGADQVIALYFITSADLVSEWFWKKPLIARSSEIKRIGFDKGYTFFTDDTPQTDHKLFHRFATDINLCGFDEVFEIDPLADLITL
jgi:hypothetical protein